MGTWSFPVTANFRTFLVKRLVLFSESRSLRERFSTYLRSLLIPAEDADKPFAKAVCFHDAQVSQVSAWPMKNWVKAELSETKTTRHFQLPTTGTYDTSHKWRPKRSFQYQSTRRPINDMDSPCRRICIQSPTATPTPLFESRSILFRKRLAAKVWHCFSKSITSPSLTNQHSFRTKNNTDNMMSRYYFAPLLMLVTLSMMMGEVESLASIVRNVRRNGIWGALGVQRNAFPQPSSVPTLPVEPVHPVSIQEDAGGFDPDKYRQEMRDLVYSRNLDRGFSV